MEDKPRGEQLTTGSECGAKKGAEQAVWDGVSQGCQNASLKGVGMIHTGVSVLTRCPRLVRWRTASRRGFACGQMPPEEAVWEELGVGNV